MPTCRSNGTGLNERIWAVHETQQQRIQADDGNRSGLTEHDFTASATMPAVPDPSMPWRHVQGWGGISTLPAFKLFDFATKLSENRNQQHCCNQSDHKQNRQECHHPDRCDQQSGETDQLLQQRRTATTGELLHAGVVMGRSDGRRKHCDHSCMNRF